jgi:hypothetical protein
MNVELIEEAQQQIARGDGLGRIREVAPTLEPPVVAADQHMRHVVMQVLVGVTHIAAEEQQQIVDSVPSPSSTAASLSAKYAIIARDTG